MTDRDDDNLPPEPAGHGDPPPEPAGTPEVVASGGAAPGGAAPGGPRRGGRVRIGLVLLGVLGVLAIILSIPGISSPERSVCGEALREIESYQDDLPEDTTETTIDVDAVSCGDADERAAAIERAESLDDVRLTSETTYRTSSVIGLVDGLLLAGGSFLTMRTGSRAARTVTLVGAGLGVVIFGLVLFPIVLAALLFGVHAIFFSADARAVFGEPGGPRFLRPRPR